MCGFVGILSTTSAPLEPSVAKVVRHLGEQIAHRGPDDSQVVHDGHYAVCFRRLSIVDIEGYGGRQPFTNTDGSLCLVVNGEIYNHAELKRNLRSTHKFVGASDCEVLLHLYEERDDAFLDEVNGMFALALWDRRKRRLILARDRLGIKPLYFHVGAQRLLFGSEIKALLPERDCPRELDWAAALQPTWQLAEPEFKINSFFRGIEYLRGGERLDIDLNKEAPTRSFYWRPPSLDEVAVNSDSRTAEDVTAGYAALLEDSVRLRLMADVEVGLFLSGGIDSVVVAMLAAEHRQVQTYSVLTESTFRNGDAMWAHKAAKLFALDNHQVVFPWHDLDYNADNWLKLLWTLETPDCDPEHLYKYELHRYARASRPNLKVILLGQGSDEFNGGYTSVYTGAEGPDQWPAFCDHFADLEKRMFLQRTEPPLARMSRILRSGFAAGLAGETPAPHPYLYYAHMYRRNLQLFNLWHEDRTASANSIENRVPFLDHRIVEYLLRVPPRLYKELFCDKRILRTAFQRRLPQDYCNRPKQPFFHGTAERYTLRMMYDIMTADSANLVAEAFSQGSTASAVLDRTVVEKWIREIPESVNYEDVPRVLRLLNMGLLDKMARDTAFAPPSATSPPVLEARPVDDWERESESIALELGSRRRDFDIDKPLRLADNVRLLSDNNGCWFISVNEALEYRLYESKVGQWLAVLREIDGQRTLREALEKAGVTEGAIRPNLEEALDYGVLQLT